MILLRKLRHLADYFFPREVMGPVVIVFSLENIVDRLFSMYMPVEDEFLGWVIVFFGALVLVAWWGVEDEEDLEELQETMEEIDNDGTN